MSIIHSVVLAFSMFSRVPMPQVVWNEKNMRYMMCGFPLVGVLIGLILWGWSLLGGILDASPLLRAAGYML
ncbi:MAG: adenosylcobinamide-GDP ribazoletransferase, partial [Clostridia bacterium]|nr:adenosylcobinamide-GDP ribazoletransferase [Clostridia bacterium]